MTEFIAGADGSRAGWVVVRETLPDRRLSWIQVPALEALFPDGQAPKVLALDIPIGLPDAGPRQCDLQARALLGPGRASSVFPAPIRPVLSATSHSEASDFRFKIEEKRLSIQAWAIIPKIRDVDAFIRSSPTARARIREIHPELCFYFMAGQRPMAAGKKTSAGRDERAALLATHFGGAIALALGDLRALGCAADDLLDAFAALWTARRIDAGEAITVPAIPPHDPFGLPMEMVA